MKKLIIVFLGLALSGNALAEPHSIEECPKPVKIFPFHMAIIEHDKESGQWMILCGYRVSSEDNHLLFHALFACAPRISGFTSTGWKRLSPLGQECDHDITGKSCAFAVFPSGPLKWKETTDLEWVSCN